MSKYNGFYILLIVLSCCNIKLVVPALVDFQFNALVQINLDMNQGWITTSASTVCSSNPNAITCDSSGEVVTWLNINTNPLTSAPPSTSIFQLVNLTNYYSSQKFTPYNIQYGSSFWAGIGALTNLKVLAIYQISEILPSNINELIPKSLESFTIYEFYNPYPESLFFDKTLSLYDIGLGQYNTAFYNIFPQKLPQISTITRLITSAMGNFNLEGTNFTSMQNLVLYYRGVGNPMSYNSFNTWSTTALYIYYDAVAAPMPSSIFSMPFLKTFGFYTNGQLTINSEIYDFSNYTAFKLYLFNVNQFSNLKYPGIKMSSYGATSLNIYSSSSIDFTKLDILSIQSVTIDTSSVNNGLPDGDYSKMKLLMLNTISGSFGELPNSLCTISSISALTVSGTSITSLPSCYICQWGNSVVTSKFNGNPSLPAYTRSCPNFQLINYTNEVPTSLGFIDIHGIDLGWVVYTTSNTPMSTGVKIGNSLLSIPVASGSGTGKSVQVKFHANVDASATAYTLNFNYLPPTITTITAEKGVLKIDGTNFINNPSLIQLYIAGKLTDLQSSTYTTLKTKSNSVPYNDNLIVSIRLVVDGQEFNRVFQPPGSIPQLYEPLPKFYSIGGYVEIPGQYLTYDNTIMNMTINGITFEIVSSTSDMYLIKYDPISPGDYPFEFNLLGYQLKSSITVRSVDTSPCKGTPTCGGPSQGICVENHCECLDGWKGEICDSQVINLPPLSPLPDQPSYNTSNDNIGLQVSIKSVRELNFNQNLIREQPLSSWTFNQNSTSEKQSLFYTTSPFTNCSIEVSIDYFNKDSIVQFANINSTKHSGTIKYSIRINSWPFIQKTNQLQLIFRTSVTNNDNSKDSCSYKTIEYEDNDNVQNVKLIDIQINSQTFSSSFSELAVVDGLVRKVNNVIILNSDQDENDSNTQSQSFIGINTPYHNDYIIIDPDFSLLVSYVPPEDKEGSICSSPSKSKLTKAQLAGIIVAASVVFIAAVIIFSYFIFTKSIRGKIIVHAIKAKIPMK
ncbi:EGF-like domain-containing protein [Tieghemostelium lacteum]|uniref:EGF-like domain-containing protein n=1 Tax=Tieghemostelium lacteum TaxID=361077 RepID=A0A151Z3Q0_TIELA|nr:EGF-like domain-containing protein [Tieghemostelium lacteum]|eukprot:KYQ88586.1 EGF-like domain-containing protein [Tieghemostelium lacteum]